MKIAFKMAACIANKLALNIAKYTAYFLHGYV